MKSLEGVYYLESEPDSAMIVLNDSVFQFYSNRYGNQWRQYSSGTWDYQRNRIVLDSYRKDRLKAFCENRSVSDCIGDKNITIQVELNANNKNEYYCMIAFVNERIAFLNTNDVRGNITFKVSCAVDSISLRMFKCPSVYKGQGSMSPSYCADTETLKTHADIGDTLTIFVQIEDSLFYYKRFDKEKFKIQRGKSLIEDYEKNI